METIEEQALNFIHEKASEYDVRIEEVMELVWSDIYELIKLIDNKLKWIQLKN